MNITFETLFPWFLLLLAVATALAFLGTLMYLYFQSRNLNKWESVSGIITKSRARIAGGGFLPAFEYTYIVLGVEYKGTALTLWPRVTYDEYVVEEWINEYPEGKQVTVYYNPNKPQLSVLEKTLW